MATLTSLGSSSEAAARTEHPSFSIPLVDALQRGEEQTHVNMDKARSAFERMKNKAAEAQAAKDKEIAELKKALALAEERVKAQESGFQEKEIALIEKNKTLSDENASLKAQISKCEAFGEQVKGIFADLRKESFWRYMPTRIQWYKTGHFPISWIPTENGSWVRFLIKAELLGLCNF